MCPVRKRFATDIDHAIVRQVDATNRTSTTSRRASVFGVGESSSTSAGYDVAIAPTNEIIERIMQFSERIREHITVVGRNRSQPAPKIWTRFCPTATARKGRESEPSASIKAPCTCPFAVARSDVN